MIVDSPHEPGGPLRGTSATRTLQRYVTNTYEAHLKAVEVVGERLGKIAG